MSDLLPEIKEISRLIGIKPSRSKGQNFLVNGKIYDFIVKAAALESNDTVLEVGPGLGFLTVRLAQAARRVLAVELDDRLAAYLRAGQEEAGLTNLEIINQDILNFKPTDYGLKDFGYKIVANLPYNISSIFLRNWLSGSIRPQSLLLMLQKEVVERIVARPSKMSLLSLSVQYYAEAKMLKTVKSGNFWPEPQVDSALLRLTLYNRPLSSDEDQKFFRLAKFGFSSKRKMLKNNLAAGLKISSGVILEILTQQGLAAGVRAQDLSLEQWRQLFAALVSFMV